MGAGVGFTVFLPMDAHGWIPALSSRCFSPQIPVDGAWGPWAPWSACSRSCGGGVSSSHRFCSRPAPLNGGRFCRGERLRFRSCKAQDCPGRSGEWRRAAGRSAELRAARGPSRVPFAPPAPAAFREEQCAAYNHRVVSAALPAVADWEPRYGGVAEEDRCKLTCQSRSLGVYHVLRPRVSFPPSGPFRPAVPLRADAAPLRAAGRGRDAVLGGGRRRLRQGPLRPHRLRPHHRLQEEVRQMHAVRRRRLRLHQGVRLLRRAPVSAQGVGAPMGARGASDPAEAPVAPSSPPHNSPPLHLFSCPPPSPLLALPSPLRRPSWPQFPPHPLHLVFQPYRPLCRPPPSPLPVLPPPPSPFPAPISPPTSSPSPLPTHLSPPSPPQPHHPLHRSSFLFAAPPSPLDAFIPSISPPGPTSTLQSPPPALLTPPLPLQSPYSYGYNDVITIPAGATHLLVRQGSPHGAHGDNVYLALRKPSGQALLNGGFVLVPSEHTVTLPGAATLRYSGATAVPEVLAGRGPLLEPLVLQALVVDEKRPPRLKYSFFVPRKAAAAAWERQKAEILEILRRRRA